MTLTYLQLKKILPELNEEIITPDRIFEIFQEKEIDFHELPLEGDGCFVTEEGKDYVFLRSAMRHLLFYKTLLYESVHALVHHPAPFLLWRHNLEAEVLSLIGMMPLSDLPRLNRIKNQLDDENYDLLMRRNKANEIWSL